jgi:serine phosphatase RsbU (regulator of sigma subunit)
MEGGSITDMLPIIGATGVGFVTNLVDTITGVYKGKAEKEAYDKAVKLQAKQQKKIEEEQQLALARARAQQNVDLALQLSQQRRQEQQMVLMIVGGVALVIAGVFLVSGMKKKPTAGATK